MIVTQHAVERYREHVARNCGRDLPYPVAWQEITDALRRPLFCCQAQSGDLLFGVRNAFWTFIAVARADGAQVEITTVGPCWYWHEARPYYRRLMGSRRHWRRRVS